MKSAALDEFVFSLTREQRVIFHQLKQELLAHGKAIGREEMANEIVKIIPSSNFDALATYLDKSDALKGITGNEVQIDLRRVAKLLLSAINKKGELKEIKP